jgi:hypothetical protein
MTGVIGYTASKNKNELILIKKVPWDLFYLSGNWCRARKLFHNFVSTPLN